MGLLKRSVELGLGALLVTKEVADELIADLSSDTEDARERGRETMTKLVERGRRIREELSQQIRDEVAEAISRAGMVTRGEYDELLQRVVELERRLAEHQMAADDVQSAAGDI